MEKSKIEEGVHRFIYWHGGSSPNGKGEVYASVHLLVGYNKGSLSDFQKMVKEFRKTFSQAKDSEIRLSRVFNSGHFDTYSIVAWNGYLPKGKYPGWIQYSNARCDYRW